jgi:2-polyprenyl-3-methyl-5-hydroxy-6-metoxy-1,4-benzoquinol methylase
MIEACTAPGVHDTVLDMIPRCKTGKLLDIGSGKGALIERLNKYHTYTLYNMDGKPWKITDIFYKLSACDIDPSQFEVKGIKCKKVNANGRLPYKDNSFDVITCTEVIEHTENPWNLIRECHRVLKKGGTLILTTPNMDNWYSKLLFLFKGTFAYFRTQDDYKQVGHITPIFWWKLKLIIDNKFNIKETRYNRAIIPLLRWTFPTKNRLFGDDLILRLEKV